LRLRNASCSIARTFAANAVCFDRVLVLSSCSGALRRELQGRGYTVAKTSVHTCTVADRPAA
jgi:broad-specificity NMP kinase